jgi:hypothetical protein
MGEMSLAQLGDSLRCPKDKEFAKVVRQDVDAKRVTMYFECPYCSNKFRNVYTTEQYERMAEMALIDPPEIIDYQRKMVIATAQLPRFDKGLQGAYYVEPKYTSLYSRGGQMLLCKCNKFYAMTIKGFKKDQIEFSQYCGECTPKSKTIKLKLESVMPLGKAGLLDADLMTAVRDEYKSALEKYDVDQTYRGNDGTISTWAQEQLGMVGDGPSRKCYICGTPISEGMQRCPKCGSDVEL